MLGAKLHPRKYTPNRSVLSLIMRSMTTLIRIKHPKTYTPIELNLRKSLHPNIAGLVLRLELSPRHFGAQFALGLAHLVGQSAFHCQAQLDSDLDLLMVKIAQR